MGKIRKVLAMLLCVAITLSMVPAFAVEVDAVDGDSPLENGVEFLDYPVSVDGEVELMVSEIATSTLFLKYPRYLSNSSMDERLWKVEDECIKVINSYSNSDAFIASLMTALSDGVSVGIGELTAQFGIGDTFYNKNLKKAAEKFLNNMMVNDQTLSSSAKKVSSKFKAIKTAYSAGEAVAKEQILKDLQELSKDRYIHLSTESLDKVVNKCYSDPGISKALKGAGNVISMAQLTIEVVELAELECEELYFLIDELEASGQGDGDLAKGLKLIRADVEKSTFEYMLEKYLDEKVIKLISKMADKLFMAVFDVSSVSFTLATLCGKIFADYIYLGPKADDIIQGASSFSFIYELSIPLSNCRAKFIQGKGTEDDIADYEILYGAYIAAHVTAGNACEDLTKDPYHCYAKAYADDLKYYNYDKYIEWCKEAVINDINNGTLNSGTGDFNIEDTTNEESLRARLAAVYELCPPNNGYIWNKQHHYANGLLGFTSYVFEMLFDKVLNPLSNTSARYELIKNDNIVLQGQLKEGNVTVNNLKTLFADARIGDVIIASGSHRNMYAGTIVAMTDNGPKVYDCNSTYNIEDLARFLVQEYVFTYDKLAAAFNSRGSQKSAAGISIYRAGHKVNTDKSESLYYETYDDSVNYIVENGVLTGYKGSRTTLEIPSNKGITEIAAGCFKNNKSLRSVYVPDTVTVIGEGAFEGCTNLQYAQLSRNLDELSNRMFYGCSSLSATRFSGRRIGDYAYYNCNVHLLDCADSIEEIGEYAFVGNDNLREIIFSDVLRAIGYRAFAGTAIEEVTIPKTVEAMHSLYNGNNFYGAFQNCNSLKKVIFEEG
ncbi:MAG: leucine-rich repeat domain-containing protein, partial [Oscillospiraceae bacterium]|nr:leucine-rich repeat domain-containing protein [Oscillospiraceae bacterium]